MARIPRRLIVCDGTSVHKIWRSHNSEWNLHDSADKAFYMRALDDDFKKRGNSNGVTVEAITLMSNHAHEVLHIQSQRKFSEQMRRHHCRYSLYFNKRHGRRGKVMLERAKTCSLRGEFRQMRTVFYIHANPLRAGIVKDANNYHWSTHRLYARGSREEWMSCVKLPEWYQKLGQNPAERQAKYRRLFDAYLRKEGLIKSNFLEAPFYGPPPWREPLIRRLKVWRRSHAPPKFSASQSNV